MTASHSRTDQLTITIGTRGSKLALAQTEIVRTAMLALHPGVEVRLETITTRGDIVQDRSLSEIGGNGVFVRAIEAALLDGTIDLAVHSAKDLPSVLLPGLAIAAYLPRADARDVLVSREGVRLMDLPDGARVGTSSPRRACQVKALRPDLTVLDIRGNVDTRLRKLREGQYDAIVLAAAGLERLGAADCVTEWLDPEVMLPAVGQGALAVEIRVDDEAVRELIAGLNDRDTWVAVIEERAFLSRVGGSCALPVGAYASVSGEDLEITGMVGSPDGRLVRAKLRASAGEPAAAGTALADDLLAGDGRALVEESLGQQL